MFYFLVQSLVRQFAITIKKTHLYNSVVRREIYTYKNQVSFKEKLNHRIWSCSSTTRLCPHNNSRIC